MDLPILSSNSSSNVNSDDEKQSKTENPSRLNENLVEVEKQAIANMQKPNVPNVNVLEKIVICLDVCYDNKNSLYRLGDGSSFTPINMLKRILDFFIYSKNAINKKTEFALMLMKDSEALWVHNSTNNLKDILSIVDHLSADESISETFDFSNVFHTLKQKVEIPKYKEENTIIPPPFVVRILVIYGRSNCLPIISQEDEYVKFLKKQLFFYLDILYTHEEDCALFKCAEIYDALQDLDDGYSYVYEVSRNARKLHDCTAKLLAHPLQRPLQKNTDYSFGSKHGL